MQEWETLISSVAMAIIGIAIVSVIVSPNAQTASVIGAASQGLATDIGAATSPVTGGNNYTGNGSLGNFGGLNSLFGSGYGTGLQGGLF